MQQNNRYALLVEDEPLVAMVAADVLDELGFRTVDAASAARALELAAAHEQEIAFAMVDLGLPDRPGKSWSASSGVSILRFPSSLHQARAPALWRVAWSCFRTLPLS